MALWTGQAKAVAAGPGMRQAETGLDVLGGADGAEDRPRWVDASRGWAGYGRQAGCKRLGKANGTGLRWVCWLRQGLAGMAWGGGAALEAGANDT
ncbi:hypothetical protein PPACK8108_LOCUS15359 [Phakopsora pachyrhizi]|uniref:Uncharacterized protein n=1 Tax=Phakopsora pachyrhizi TaxID=170000 RepID=A0AAV0BBF7_PHAPC|nr:hypothetical protein PPACK8108_LOCUS15359 [Phakopsora pachyrhizi]